MVNIPSNLQNLWNEVSKDGKIDKDDFEKLARQAVNFDKLKDQLQSESLTSEQKVELMNTELDTSESAFLKALEPAKEGVVLNVKNGTAPGTFDFVDTPAPEIKSASVEEPVKTENNTEVNETPQPSGNEFDIPAVDHQPGQVPLLPIHQWSGYNPQINSSFSEIFSINGKNSGIPVVNQNKGKEIASSLGFGSVEDLQTQIGAKTDNKYGPETHTKTKAYISSQINNENKVEALQELKKLVTDLASKNVLGKDPELTGMIAMIDQKINTLSSANVLKNYDTAVRGILSQTDPKNAESLAQAKSKLMEEYNKLPEPIKTTPQADLIHTSAMAKVFKATKSEIIGSANAASETAVNEALKSGDPAKLADAKNTAQASVEKLTKLESEPDFQKAKEILAKTNPAEAAMTPENVKTAVVGRIDKAETLIQSISDLINKKGWNSEDRASADELIKELPDGDFKDKFQKAIDSNTEKAQLMEKNRGNIKTAVEGLSDVIGNGFWNLENTDGTKAMFQLVAKQGLLDETIRKMNVDDQKEAIKILTSGIKDGKMTGDDDFNLAIAQKIYQNLSQSMNVDGDFDKKKVLPKLKEAAPENFDSFNINENSFVKGMKFSLGVDRAGSEKEAAVTMGRAIINGEVPASILSRFTSSEIKELVSVMGDKGSKEDKAALLKMVSSAYNEGKPVSIDSLDKKEKAVVIKNVLESENRNEGQLKELVKKSGDGGVYEAVRKQDLSDKSLAILAKHTDGDDMADEPDVAAKLLVGMIKTYNEQGGDGEITLKDINDFIKEIDKDWWEDDDTMKLVVDQLGDGPESAYDRFRRLAPSTLDKIRNIAD